MESNPLVLTDPNLLAEFVRESEFKTFFEKRFASPPDLAALLFRDGALIDSFKGTQFSVGGLWENIKGLIGGSHHYAIMLADLKPFQVQFPVKGMSRDQVEISGVATLELQLNPDKSSNILGLMSGVSRNETDPAAGEAAPGGRKALSRFDVQTRIEPQFQDRVFEHVIGRHDAMDIRGNRGLQDQIQADMMTEAERICGDIGVLVRNGSITWAMNEVEREQFEKAQIARQQEALDYQLELLKRHVARQGESTSVQIRSVVDEAKLKQASEDELALMTLNSEISFVDAREVAVRRQEMEALLHEIEILRTERAGRFENELANAGQTIDLAKEQGRLQGVQRDIDALEQSHRRTMLLLDKQSDSEIGDIDIGMGGRRADEDLRQTGNWQDLARKNLEGLNRVEGDKADRDTDRTLKVDSVSTENRIRESQADAQNRVAQMAAASGMTPEQIEAITASYSKDSAEVAIAKANAMGGQKLADMMREVTEQSREHEHRILQTGMLGATGVAAGAGGGPATMPGTAGPADTVECPECGKTLAAKANYCTGCGHQMRT
jgi:hypothetical protein